jgi:hypothetical protein
VVGPLGQADGRFFVAGTGWREARERHRTRFAYRSELRVAYGQRPDTDFIPLGSTVRLAAVGVLTSRANG